MRLDVSIPRTRRQAKAVFILRAMFTAKPGKERKAAKRAAKAFNKANPKPSRKAA